MPPAVPARPAFLLLEAGFLALTLAGGPPWTVLSATALSLVAAVDFRPRAVVFAAPALAWLVAARETGNREFFFPFAMHLAGHVAARARPSGGRSAALTGAAVVAAFLAIRASQRALPRVLAVEAAVAAAILAAILAAARIAGRREGVREDLVGLAIALGAGLLAVGGLRL